MDQELKQRICTYIEDKGLKYAVVAKKMGITRQSLYRILKTDAPLKLEFVNQIETALNHIFLKVK